MEALEKELRDREERLNQGNHLFDWISSEVKKGNIRIDERGRPNIIGNEEDQEIDDEEVE